jgi:uncharacterized protein (DUF927 family)
MSDDDTEAVIACSRYPAGPEAHFLNMVMAKSTIEECSACNHKIYVSSSVAEMRTNPEYTSVEVLCLECVGEKYPDEEITMSPETRNQLGNVLTEDQLVEVEEAIENVPVSFLERSTNLQSYLKCEREIWTAMKKETPSAQQKAE